MESFWSACALWFITLLQPSRLGGVLDTHPFTVALASMQGRALKCSCTSQDEQVSFVACSYSEELGKWIEVGNSGMFRPEMLQPMGLPEDVNVIAWGLSLER